MVLAMKPRTAPMMRPMIPQFEGCAPKARIESHTASHWRLAIIPLFSMAVIRLDSALEEAKTAAGKDQMMSLSGASAQSSV
jgi:hypothetical protein